MSNIIISPYAISYDNIKTALQAYITAKSNIPNVWSDFYNSGAGQTIIELDSAIAAFLAFHAIVSRRESLITVANNYNSVLGLAESLGYNASRGHNLYLDVSLVPNISLSLPKWTIIGQYNDYDLILREDTLFVSGVRLEVPIMLGNSQVQKIDIIDDNLQQFTFTSPDITDDCRLLLNGTEVPSSTELKDSADDKYVLLSNTYGGVDVFYLNQGKYNYKRGDVLYLQFVQRNTVSFSDIAPSSLVMFNANDEYSVELSLYDDRLGKESIDHIRQLAPIFHETNNVVRARKDYVKLLKQSNVNVIDANDKDINPGLIAITYLKKRSDEGVSNLMTSKEKQDYVKYMMSLCPDGVATAIIQDPIRVVRNLYITVKLKDTEQLPVDYEYRLQDIFSEFKNKLAPSFNLDDIEHKIERIPGIKTARVTLGGDPYETNKKYKLYDTIVVKNIDVGGGIKEDWLLYCSKVTPATGEQAPDWSSCPNYGDTIVDNNFVWENQNKYGATINAKWKKDGTYEIFSDIKVEYEIMPHCVTDTEPIWGNNIINDGNITWGISEDSYSSLIDNYAQKVYDLNDYMQITKDNNRAIYKCTEITHKTSATEPSWATLQNEGDQLIDNAVTWKLLYKGWQPSTYLSNGDKVAVNINDVIYVYECNTDTADALTGTDLILDGSDEIVETVKNEYTSVVTTIVWRLVDTVTGLSTWEPNAECALDTIIKPDVDYYQAININNTLPATNTIFFDEVWVDDIVDNNVHWELQQSGLIWEPGKAYQLKDKIITNGDATYIYECKYSKDSIETRTNVVFSVISYAGVSGSTAPEWKYTYKNSKNEDVTAYANNVVDGDILWTKTDNAGSAIWQENHQYYLGDIIAVTETDELGVTTIAAYYTFTSILGTSGDTEPNWLSLESNQIQDNNITWTKINDNTNIYLQWNEYLDLTTTVVQS